MSSILHVKHFEFVLLLFKFVHLLELIGLKQISLNIQF